MGTGTSYHPFPASRVVSSSRMNSPEAAGATDRLRNTLDRVRRVMRGGLLLEVVSIAVAVAALVVLIGLAAAAVGASGRLFAFTLVSAMLLGLLGALGYGVWRWRQLLRSDDAVAAWVDQAAPGAEPVSVLSAVELSRDRGRYGESPRLADVAVAHVAERSAETDSDSRRAVGQRSFRMTAAAAGLAGRRRRHFVGRAPHVRSGLAGARRFQHRGSPSTGAAGAQARRHPVGVSDFRPTRSGHPGPSPHRPASCAHCRAPRSTISTTARRTGSGGRFARQPR